MIGYVWDRSSFFSTLKTVVAALNDPIGVIPTLPEYLPAKHWVKWAYPAFDKAQQKRAAIWEVWEYFQEVHQTLMDFYFSEEFAHGEPTPVA
jgi:hypothetical protein